MANWLDSKTQGIILLVLAAIIWAPLPNILPWSTIAAILLVGLGIYNIVK
jgi:hypothetical protein